MAVTKFRFLVVFLLAFTLPAGNPPEARSAPEGEKLFAVVFKVDGKGIARLRRAIGTEAVVGSQMEVYPGDRIVTDDDSTVDLALLDGTIIRVGINSEFRLSEAQLRQKLVSWVFSLVQGSIRTLAEKSFDHKRVKMRVNSPSGTMGIRGTEVIFSFDPASGQTALFTLEGIASFGGVDCEKTNGCVDVRTGTFSRVSASAPKANPPAAFRNKELFGLPDTGGKSDPDRQRLVLLQGVARANAALAAMMSDAEVKKAIDDARDSFQEQQDGLLSRTAEVRKAMHAAMAQGTYERVIKIAENYETSRGRGAEMAEFFSVSVGPMAVRKFALGLAIVESPEFRGNASGPKGAEALLAKDSESLRRAFAWSESAAKDPSSAPFVSINGPAENPGQLDGRELRPLTAVEKALLKDPAVQTNFNELAATSQGVSTAKSQTCGALCAQQKYLSGAYAPPPPAPPKSSKKGRRKSPGSDGCERFVTVCTYKKMNGRREKVCNQVCKDGNSRSSPAN